MLDTLALQPDVTVFPAIIRREATDATRIAHWPTIE